jgi:DNA-binding NtrC family response regulator
VTASKLTVLIVDDEPGVREVLEELLTELGYAPISAATGVAGLTALKKKPADAVLLDIAMPGALGGLETLRAVRGSWPDLPVIMVTANIDEAIAKATLREGAFDYVMKPLTMERLRAVLAAAVALSGKVPPA